MPAVAAVVLAGLGALAFLQRETRPWGVAFVLAVAVATVMLTTSSQFEHVQIYSRLEPTTDF